MTLRKHRGGLPGLQSMPHKLRNGFPPSEPELRLRGLGEGLSSCPWHCFVIVLSLRCTLLYIVYVHPLKLGLPHSFEDWTRGRLLENILEGRVLHQGHLRIFVRKVFGITFRTKSWIEGDGGSRIINLMWKSPFGQKNNELIKLS